MYDNLFFPRTILSSHPHNTHHFPEPMEPLLVPSAPFAEAFCHNSSVGCHTLSCMPQSSIFLVLILNFIVTSFPSTFGPHELFFHRQVQSGVSLMNDFLYHFLAMRQRTRVLRIRGPAAPFELLKPIANSVQCQCHVTGICLTESDYSSLSLIQNCM